MTLDQQSQVQANANAAATQNTAPTGGRDRFGNPIGISGDPLKANRGSANNGVQAGSIINTTPTFTTPQTASPDKMVAPPIVSTPEAAQNDLAEKKTFLDTTKTNIAGQADKNATTAQTQKDYYDKNPYFKRPEEDVAGYNARIAQMQKSGAIPTTPQEEKLPDGTFKVTDSTGNTTYHDANGNPIAPPNPQVAAANTAIANENTSYQSETEKIQGDIQSATTEFQNTVNQIKNGTIPLNPIQQSQLDASNALFSSTIGDMKQSLDSYTQAMQGNAARTGGLTGSVGSILSSLTYAAKTGRDAMLKADATQTKAIADMESGFMKDDYALISDSYNAYIKAEDGKQAAIDKLHGDLISSQKDLRDFQYKTTQDNLTQILENKKFSLSEKQDAIDNTLKQSQLDETTRHNLATEAQAKMALQLQYQAQNAGLEGTHPVVNMTANNTPDKTQQASYLASLPGGATGDLATLVKQVADYKINPSSIPTRNYRGVGGLTQSQVLTLVSQYDPSFSQQSYASRQSLLTNFTSGKYSQNINSLNTAVGHISDIIGNFSGLGNAGFTPYNSAKNAIANIFGSGEIGRAGLNIQAATSELASVFKGSGATDQEIAALGTLNTASSPAQVKAYVETATQLLASRLQALQDTYTSGMGKAPTNSFLSSTSQQALLKLQQSGVDVKIPQLADSPVVLLQTFHDSSDANKNLLDGIMANHPELKNNPSAAIDFLAQQGINL
jgi:hypothetical protein